MTYIYIYKNVHNKWYTSNYLPPADWCSGSSLSSGRKWDELPPSSKFSFHIISYGMQYYFGQLKSGILILSPPNPFLVWAEKLEWSWLQTALLSSNYKHWCVISIVFLLEPKHSTIPDILKKESQLKTRQNLICSSQNPGARSYSMQGCELHF